MWPNSQFRLSKKLSGIGCAYNLSLFTVYILNACKITRHLGSLQKVDRFPPEARLVQTEAATRGVPSKKVFLEISQNSQENTCTRVSFLIKLQAYACNFIKKETPA